MIQAQLSRLWAFARGDMDGVDFETWFLTQSDLVDALGEHLHWQLASASYSDRDELWLLRRSLAAVLAQFKRCECPSVRDFDAISMGADFHFAKIFLTLHRELEYGPEKWWLYISKCSVCRTVWLVAQDDRIYDHFVLKRISGGELAAARSGRWPARFQTYEDVLASGRKFGDPPRFIDPTARSLAWTVEDLLHERPSITVEEIGYLLGLSNAHAEVLVDRAKNCR